MRTTLTLDKDVADVIERLRKTRRESKKDIVNEALREGLKYLVDPPRKRSPFHTASVDLGRCLRGNIDNVAEVSAVGESELFE